MTTSVVKTAIDIGPAENKSFVNTKRHREQRKIYPLRTYFAIRQMGRTTTMGDTISNASGIAVLFNVLRWRSHMYIDTIPSWCRATVTLRCGVRGGSHTDTDYTNYISLGIVNVSITGILTWYYIDVVNFAVVTSSTVCCGEHVTVGTGILSHKRQCL